MENEIVRTYPIKKKLLEYPERYDSSVFQKINEMKNDTDLQNNLIKWKNGINYETNRKIKIGGILHKQLENPFLIYVGPIIYGNFINYEKLKDLNEHEYLKVSNELKSIFDEENKIPSEYNDLVDSVIKKMQKVEKLEEYIVFEGIKYGSPYINKSWSAPRHKDKIPDNNCVGFIIESYSEGCRCRSCENWGGCSNPSRTQYYKCTKCGYEFSESISYSNSQAALCGYG